MRFRCLLPAAAFGFAAFPALAEPSVLEQVRSGEVPTDTAGLARVCVLEMAYMSAVIDNTPDAMAEGVDRGDYAGDATFLADVNAMSDIDMDTHMNVADTCAERTPG